MVAVRTKVRALFCSLRPKSLSALRVPNSEYYSMITVIGQRSNAYNFRLSTRAHMICTREGIRVVVGIRTGSFRRLLCDLIHIGKQPVSAHVEEHVLADTYVKAK